MEFSAREIEEEDRSRAGKRSTRGDRDMAREEVRIRWRDWMVCSREGCVCQWKRIEEGEGERERDGR
ncbi:hypothetical protein CDL15_Pgr018596 [Punica granatum]|uniref:Uncharacterized protein n=1 Tax=Punica granatum TaxID=22663 RepID=A0A218WZ24_PUNGR|nr:hypothetical protein CDL15_Pgr018596 [Punica granatum]